MYCGRAKSSANFVTRLMDGNRKGMKQLFPTAIPQEKYLFCRFSAYVQVLLAKYVTI